MEDRVEKATDYQLLFQLSRPPPTRPSPTNGFIFNGHRRSDQDGIEG